MNTSSSPLRAIFVVALALALHAGRAVATQPSSGDEVAPEHHAADPSAAEVTAANLLASERFWPYTVELTRAWKGPGAASEAPAGTRGVLIRIESNGKPRIDFGRHGIGEPPLDRTDLLARANRVRLGTEAKHLPNFVEAIGPRLLDPTATPVRPVPMQEVFARTAFVAVFADVDAPAFAELAAALGPLAARGDAMTIVFPRGRPLDLAVYERLRSLDWKVPFVFQHLADPYTASLVGDPPPASPWVTVQTNEGRVLFAGGWSPDLAKRVASALDEAASRSASTANREDSEETP